MIVYQRITRIIDNCYYHVFQCHKSTMRFGYVLITLREREPLVHIAWSHGELGIITELIETFAAFRYGKGTSYLDCSSVVSQMPSINGMYRRCYLAGYES